VVHVDDLMVTSVSESDLNDLCAYLKAVYPERKETRGDVVDYIGMTFDFTKEGEVSVTMDNCVNDILVGYGVTKRPNTFSMYTTRRSYHHRMHSFSYVRSEVTISGKADKTRMYGCSGFPRNQSDHV
jgi:hypothetical protein